jgi:hypothetical protein
MATYASYKKVDGSSIVDGSINEDRISLSSFGFMGNLVFVLLVAAVFGQFLLM